MLKLTCSSTAACREVTNSWCSACYNYSTYCRASNLSSHLQTLLQAALVFMGLGHEDLHLLALIIVHPPLHVGDRPRTFLIFRRSPQGGSQPCLLLACCLDDLCVHEMKIGQCLASILRCEICPGSPQTFCLSQDLQLITSHYVISTPTCLQVLHMLPLLGS